MPQCDDRRQTVHAGFAALGPWKGPYTMQTVSLMRNSGMLSKTKISKGFQTVIPSAVRSTFAVEPGDYVEWERGSDGLVIRFRKRKRLRDLEGIGGSPADAVEVKKRAQRGVR